MLKSDDVIIVSQNDQSSPLQYGLFLSREGSVVHFKTLNRFVERDGATALTTEHFATRTISLNVFSITSVPGKSGLRDFANVILGDAHRFIDEEIDPGLVDLVRDDRKLLIDVALFDTGTSRCSKAVERAMELLSETDLASIFFRDNDYTRCQRSADGIRSISIIKRMILHKRSKDIVYRVEDFGQSKASLLLERLIQINRLEAQRWIRHLLLRRSRSISEGLKNDLIEYCIDAAVLIRFCIQHSDEAEACNAVLDRLRKIDKESWEEFIETEIGKLIYFNATSQQPI